MTQKRFARLTKGFSKKLNNHEAAVSLYVAHSPLLIEFGRWEICVTPYCRWSRTGACG